MFYDTTFAKENSSSIFFYAKISSKLPLKMQSVLQKIVEGPPYHSHLLFARHFPPLPIEVI
jgi:hypothetical protein